jgi:translation initiation factor IF-1
MTHGANVPERQTPGASQPVPGQRAEVLATLTNGLFRLRMPNGQELVAHVAKDLRKAFPRLLAGDLVEIEVSPFDSSKARIRARIEPNRCQQPPVPSNQPQQREQS